MQGTEYEDTLSGDHCRHLCGNIISYYSGGMVHLSAAFRIGGVSGAGKYSGEAVVDLATEEKKPLAKIAKDTAAGAVLFSAIISVIIGLVIFLPYVMELLQKI